VHVFNSANLDLILRRPYWWPIAETPLYRPLTTLSYLLNYSVLGHGDQPFGYHAANLALHIVNVWLLFALVLRISRRFWPAVLGAALWAVHPIGTEAVTNIVGRADLLAGFGVLGALYAHLRSGDATGASRWAWRLACVGAMTAGVFSKESAVAGVGLIILFDLLWRNEARLAGLVRNWIVSALPVLVFLLQRRWVLGAAPAVPIPFVDNPIAGASFLTGRLTALAVMGRYLALLSPTESSADYSFAQIPLASGTLSDWLAWVAVGGVAAIALVAFRRHRELFFWLAAALISFLPVANVLIVTGTIMADRLMYLPSAFLVSGIVATVYPAAARGRLRAFAPALLSAAIVACAIGTFVRNDVWRDELHLWRSTIITAPNSFKSHDSLAEALYESDPTHDNLDQVIGEEEKSLAILARLPDSEQPPRPFRAAASYYLERGEWLEKHRANPAVAEQAYRRAAELGERYLTLVAAHPVSVQDTNQARLLVSTAYAHVQDGDKAVNAARIAAANQPFDPAAYRTLAAALLNARQPDDAALELMTGFIVTGNAELRSALVDLYRGGGDPEGCATAKEGSNIVLNVSCEIVRRHLCAAAARARELQQRAGRSDLAAQVSAFTKDAHCDGAK